MEDRLARLQAKRLLSLALKSDGSVDENKILAIVKELMAGKQPNMRRIAKALGCLADHKINQQRAIITTAVPANSAMKEQIFENIKRRHPQVVSAEWRQDSSLLGGFTVQIGDLWYDASIANDLSTIREHISQ